jgi:hypothetical protein
MIHAAGVIESGIELDRVIVSACPVDESLLSIRGRGQDKAQERSEGAIAESDGTIFQEEAQWRGRAGENFRDVRTSDVWPRLE